MRTNTNTSPRNCHECGVSLVRPRPAQRFCSRRCASIHGGALRSAGPLEGRQFGRLTVVVGRIARTDRFGYQRLFCLVFCSCDPSQFFEVRRGNLLTDQTHSCGCLFQERVNRCWRRHDGARTRLYSLWEGMKRRCLNPNASAFEHYGGRGITVCSEWLKGFTPFRQWAEQSGYRDDLSLDRIDVNGNYEPNNCRFVSFDAQKRNTRQNRFLEAFGERKTFAEWSRDPRCTVDARRLGERMKAGWSAEEALLLPRSVSWRRPKP